MAFVFEDEITQPKVAQAEGRFVFDDTPEEHPISSYGGGDLTPEERFNAVNPDYSPTAPDWAAKHPNLYGAVGATWEVAKPFVELGGAAAGAAPGVVATAIPGMQVVGPVATLAGGGAGYATAKKATREVDKWLGVPEDLSGGPLTEMALKGAGVTNAPQSVKDMLTGAEYVAEGEAISRGATATGRFIKNQFQEMPSRIVNSLVKPLLKDFSYGKNPGRAIAEERIVANNFDDLVSKISAKRQEIGTKLGTLSETLDKEAVTKGLSIDLTNVLNPIDDAIAKAYEMPRTNSALMNRLEDLKKDIIKSEAPAGGPTWTEFLKGKMGPAMKKYGNHGEAVKALSVEYKKLGQEVPTRKLSGLTFKETLDIKRKIGDATKWTGNASDDKAVNAALKKVYGRIKETTNSKAGEVSPARAFNLRKLNEKYADLTSAEIAAKYRDKIIERQNIVSLQGHIGALGMGLLTFVQTGGQAIPAIIAGAGGAALDKALGSTAVKTRIAAWLAKATPQQIKAIETKAPGFAAAIQRTFPAQIMPRVKAIYKSNISDTDKERFLTNLYKQNKE